MSMSIEQIKFELMKPQQTVTKPTIIKEEPKKNDKKKKKDLIEDSDSEDDDPVPWTMEALGGDFDTQNIISTLTDEEHYTYNTKKSRKEFQNMFRIICQTMEDIYLERN